MVSADGQDVCPTTRQDYKVPGDSIPAVGTRTSDPRATPFTRRRETSSLYERQQVGVDLVCMRGRHPVRETGIGF